MDKKEFKGLNADQRANYINEKMLCGDSFNKVCQELKISTSQYTYLEKHGYKLDKEKNQFVKQQIEGQESFINNINVEVKTESTDKPQESEKEISNRNTPLEVKEAIEEPKKSKGRPQIHKEGDRSKITFEIDNRTIKALKLKKVIYGIKLNEYIEQLLNDNIEPKFFNMAEK